MSDKVIYEEHALGAGWLGIAGVCTLLAIAPHTELAFWARALILLLGASSLLIGLTRRSRSVWLDEDSSVLLVRQSSVFGMSERRVALSDINAIECIMVSAGAVEYDNGYRSRLTLKSGEHVYLTRSYASRLSPVVAPESPPFKVARILREKLPKEISQQDRG
jgi:hypothetical protein